jgi:Bacterial Ig domain
MTKICSLGCIALLLSFATTVHASEYEQITPTTTLTIQTSNNTAAANTFPGCEITTVTNGQCVNNGDLQASNISKVDVHTLLSPSQQGAKVYTTYIPYWVHGTHPNIGYSSQDPNQVAKEITDLTSRGFDGVIIDWYGPGSYEEGASEILKSQMQQQNALSFALMIDQGAIEWFSCYPNCSATTAVLDLIAFARQQGYFSSSAAIRNSDGKTIVTQFGMEAYNINWATIESQNPDLEWIFENAGAFTNQYTIGAYGWLSPKDPLQQGYEGLDYTQYFEQIAGEHPSKKNWASTWKGFNDVVANWAPPGGRHIQQLCGKTWIDSWGAVRDYTGRLDAVQVVTWHDYEEGTEIQTGIDNCLSISASVSGSTLNWSVNDDSTLDHYVVYISADGQNLMSLGDFPVGTGSLNLAPYNFAPGSYYMYVQAVGKPSIKNYMSAAATYHVGTARQPTVTITAPYNGEDAGPATNLNAGATSPNGQIAEYQVYLDGTLYRTLSGGPSFQLWVSTSMGMHTIEVKAEDVDQQWGTANVWIVRTY